MLSSARDFCPTVTGQDLLRFLGRVCDRRENLPEPTLVWSGTAAPESRLACRLHLAVSRAPDPAKASSTARPAPVSAVGLLRQHAWLLCPHAMSPDSAGLETFLCGWDEPNRRVFYAGHVAWHLCSTCAWRACFRIWLGPEAHRESYAVKVVEPKWTARGRDVKLLMAGLELELLVLHLPSTVPVHRFR